MCLAIPMKVTEKREDNTGVVESSGVQREVDLSLIQDLKIGDWVLIHAGLAISRLEEEDAQETIKLLKEAKIIE